MLNPSVESDVDDSDDDVVAVDDKPKLTRRQAIENLKQLQHYFLSSSNDETDKLKFVESWIKDEESAPTPFQ